MVSNAKHICITGDGSATILSEQHGAYYHSLRGAFTESMHIFIEAGLMHVSARAINLLEVGFGTGLNAALTAQRAFELGIHVNYCSVELYPLSGSEYSSLNYVQVLPRRAAQAWTSICDAPWEEKVDISTSLSLLKVNADFTRWVPTTSFSLIYFDAFAPDDQPEMWSKPQFQKIYNALLPGGVLVTYSVKGEVRRILTEVGFTLERLLGPPGKRHILRATKPSI
ncbi:MAG TPA: tRNA (5-methylaminomethyl-2-thiouridine)(34)-methyltransferase MnmD [Perlabentimonas sp.]|jgi:tRNA U34 5-methylaminomethyl-2-thiouridine-forming methyltransferase MnmC|nr:tRNA (5-methylaminomethyl-2-thiouridine)(34)-methyltransferase MnmD [Bacteroidales bacterium]MDD4672505.1 tRNA (5-methylaminomethyl-2-thiouridine)(34)-methyltransferase MnmD [Bacteroidales bacterium]MDY0349416.1 tRNA (5-methylaminomethyl-2-thiouridine)(34)-methyltransferase MnmD [Tenuifilaceae bacterium]HZJ74483.1 tRNA (5-methylaminomethyl-2-thiouridine)(34)-methyltransferase MnmD [Perlabentimonas sp.]